MSLSTHCTLQAVSNTHLTPLIPAFPGVERGSRLEQHPRTDKRGQGREGRRRRARHPSESTDQVLIRCRDAITHPGAVPAPQSGWTRGLGTFGYICEDTRLSCPRTGDSGQGTSTLQDNTRTKGRAALMEQHRNPLLCVQHGGENQRTECKPRSLPKHKMLKYFGSNFGL